MCASEYVAPDVARHRLREEISSLRKSQRRWLGLFGPLLIALAVMSIRIFRFELEYIMLVILIALLYLAGGSLVYSRRRGFRRIAVQIEDERRRLEETDLALQRVDDELKSRIDKERVERTEQQWVDATTRSISLQFKSTVIPDEIADTMVESLGRTLKVDFVVFYSYGKFRRVELWRQWSQTSATQIDFSRIAKYESNLLDFVNNLGEGSHAVVVSDSRLINISRGPFPEIVETAKELARSFVFVPVGVALHGLGYVWMGMKEEVRVWSPVEVELIQQVASDSAQALAHAWMFGQTMQMAENDAKIGRMAELDKVKNDFIENINHELRTPLTSIIGYVEMIIGDVDSVVEPRLAESLAVVQRNALRLQSLIVSMMQISKPDFEHAPLDIATVDIGKLLGEAIKSMELGAEDSGVGLVLRLDSLPDELLVDGDLNRLQQVFVNLLSNAIKFTPREGKVTVVARSVHTDGDYVEVTIADTGIGIPPDEFPNMFKRFFRASTATEASIPGFGIGLSLVHSIVGEHHGTITFDSTVGKGTMFMVRLPARHSTIEPVDEMR